MLVLAIIPARGGSKRIPRKNIKMFCGKPIIDYSIKAALQSTCFDEVIVSTEDSEIAAISKSCGASIPFLRSKQNSDDYSQTADVIEEVLLQYKKLGRSFDFFCCIYPTAPFVTSEKLRKSYELLKTSDADGVIPVVRFSYPIQRALKIEDDRIKMMWPENYNKRSNDLSPTYHDCGQFYWMRTKSFLEQKRLFAQKSIPFEIPEIEAQDIDNEEDWRLAEVKYKCYFSQ